ncbi:hypothetical protein COO60DRAFT_538614 [Scenedesmus sp. NREL 46B-D3]|nr:hypothetical protein COO60DRAFT_538614 [Scenedesmus sp. NREL 46B-D3]
MCLPQQLQLQWQQQPAHAWLPAPSSTEELPEAKKPAAAAAAGGEQGVQVSSSSSSEALGEGKAGSSSAEKQQAVTAGTEAAPRVGGSDGSHQGDTAAAAAAAAAAASVPWYLPLTQFPDRTVEQRYVSWKHSSLLQLDYGAVMFCAFYLLTLLRRMMSEPTTLFYLLYMIIKTMPHVPLALGLRQTYLRRREEWLLLVGPVTALMVAACPCPLWHEASRPCCCRTERTAHTGPAEESCPRASCGRSCSTCGCGRTSCMCCWTRRRRLGCLGRCSGCGWRCGG